MEAQGVGQMIDHASLKEEKFGDDAGCSFRFKDDHSIGMTWTRTRGDDFLTVQCMHPDSGDADADATCLQLVAALKAQ
jgi:hypothetical protein